MFHRRHVLSESKGPLAGALFRSQARLLQARTWNARYWVAMSEENVDVVRAQIDAYNRRDYDAALLPLDEDVEWQVPHVAALDAPAGGVVRGKARVVEQFTRWLEAWETHSFEVTDARGHGEHVFVAGLQVGRGRHSGVDIRVPTFHVYTLRDRRIVAMRAFRGQAEALEAAGLSK